MQTHPTAEIATFNPNQQNPFRAHCKVSAGTFTRDTVLQAPSPALAKAAAAAVERRKKAPLVRDLKIFHHVYPQVNMAG